MKKRILSLLLAFLMVMSMLPVPTYAENSTDTTPPSTESKTEALCETSAESSCTTCGKSDCTSAHTNWCKICLKDDCGLEHKTCKTCGTVDCKSSHENWCAVCRKDDCGKEHKTCGKCGTVDCTADHSNWCATCKTDNCGVDHTATVDAQPCEKCGSTDCAGHENWCDTCKKDNCGKEHTKCTTCGTVDCTAEHKSCDKCGAVDCSADHSNWCSDCKKDNCGKTHVFCETCQKNDCGVDHSATAPTEAPTEAPADKTATGDSGNSSESAYRVNIGRKATINPIYVNSLYISADPSLEAGWSSVQPTSDPLFTSELTLVITDVYDNGTELWYKVKAAEGHTLPDSLSAKPWIFQNVIGDSQDYDSLILVEAEPEEKCPICGKPGCTTEHSKCEICGKYDCSSVHLYCELCDKHDCGKAHLYCLACEKYDCSLTHTFCGYCNIYDCGTDHKGMNKPAEVPVIPAAPTLTDGAEVSIVDEAGDPVTDKGLRLAKGMRTSLSAWSDMDNASYQWQVRYDKTGDLWADIQGQTKKGILVSPAMFMSIIEEQGAAAIRCVVTSGEETKISDVIPVSITGSDSGMPLTLASRATSPTSRVKPLADAENPGELEKTYVVVQYQYSDGRTAAASDFAQSIPGAAYSHSYQLPVIPGYKATLKTHAYGNSARIVNGDLVVDFAENVLTEAYTIFTVVYVPDFVNVTVIHYWQNVDNDNYTEHERETVSTRYKTGEQITNAHQAYPGFYHLLYETPTAAADGSTVIEVYYDRYYYLMKFELSGGYGVDPIYARTGAEIEIGTPTRPGYTFLGWALNGADAVVPREMPPENRTYIARWEPKGAVEYTIVYWKENADDSNYSYWTQRQASAMPGTTVSGSNSVANYVTDEQYFTYNDHLTDKDVVVKGDGSTIVNVYYNRNYYTLVFYYNGDCNIETHTHGTDCNRELICGDGGHVHNADCERTLTCTIQEHIHTDACSPQCGLPIHTAHTQSCLVCDKELHPAHTLDDGCYTPDCSHTHTVDCYYANNNYTLRSTTKPSQLGNNLGDGIHTYTGGNSWNPQTYYYLKLGNTWYCAYRNSYSSATTQIYERCTHTCSIDAGCYDLSCTIPLHPEHTDAEGCYADVIHSQHTDTCYSHASHSHTEDCYVYECGQTPHEHNNTCYRECTKFAHTHGTSCRYGNTSSGTNAYEIYRVITAKYEAYIGDQWPTADDIDGFAYWTGAGANQSSRVVTMTGNYCDEDGIKLLANYNSTKYTLNYWFEHFDQTVTPDNVTYKSYNGVIYKLSEVYSQIAYYSSNLSGWQHKAITGMTAAVSGNAQKENGNVFNLYYKRNRVNLSFYNVNEIVKTVPNLMFEQPLADYVDTDGTLLSSYEPEFPTNAYEPGSRSFAGWYTTADCIPGTEVVFSELTMPINDLTLYAKWAPVSHKVNYYMTQESLNRGENIPAEMARLVDEAVAAGSTRPANNPYADVFAEDSILHGTYIEDLVPPGVSEGYESIHPRAGYEFVGWFYLNADGEEIAFDPENMPVDQDLNLYAKWSANKLCKYNIYFALDEDADGRPDVDVSGNIIYIAAPMSGSGIAGRTYTFTAKGSEELYEAYRDGYFPTVGSHSIVIDIADEQGTAANSYTFLYQEKQTAPYTVRYVDKDTGESLLADKVVSDNRNIVVTENFQYIQGYMPDAYQKTLVVEANSENVITFYYTKDESHALYVVNYYIQELDEDLNHKGWTKYTDLQSTGNIGEYYSASTIDIDGFTLSPLHTDDFNTNKKINGATGLALPSPVSNLIAAEDAIQISGQLSDKGLELNFYYTRNLYPFEFRYMLNGTTTELADPVVGKGAYDTIVTEVAKEIVMDLDGDGVNEDYRLYDPTETSKDIHIVRDGAPLTADAVVEKGDATVNIATFYYVRCTQTMTITKHVVDNSAESDPNPDQEFTFSLLIHAKDGYHRNSYSFRKSDGTEGTLSPEISAPNTLQFALKAGQTITIEGLPTAEYTVSELNLPTGYDDTSGTNVRNKLTVDEQLDLTVTNTYDPANLTITKTVDVVEDNSNVPEIYSFAFTVTVPDSVTGSYAYTIGNTRYTATVTDGKMAIALQAGQTATFLNLPVGTYTVTEADYSAYGYDSNYRVNDSEYTEGVATQVVLAMGTTQAVEFMNKFPVGDLTIEKTVSKEFYGTAWSGDTFTFTVERTVLNRPLITGNQYRVLVDGVEQTAMVVADADGKLTVTIPFSQTDAEILASADSSVKHTLVIKNLPAGTYSVTEGRNDAYVQTPDNLAVGGLRIPAENVTASFTNTLKRGMGNLSLHKEMEVLTGFNPPVDSVKFGFTIELLEGIPAQDQTFAVVYSPAQYTDGTAANTAVTMSGGSFTVMLEKDQTVTVNGLPEGKYRITEVTVPYYANAFAHRENGSWVVQSSMTTADGQMYTEINIETAATAEVKCTNTYPVDRAELIIQKLVTKEYDRDTLPGDTFTFTVALAEEDADSYSYRVYDADGNPIGDQRTATVTDQSFTVELEAGQYAVIPGMPVCGYTVSEDADTTNYNASYEVYVSETGESASTAVNTAGTVNASGTGVSVSRTFSAGKTDAVIFTNQYKRHLGTLTIRKTVEGTAEQDTFIFHIKGISANNSHIQMDVTVTGSGEVTVFDLPLGSYTVTENTDWSWRYTNSEPVQTADLTADPDAQVTFTNVLSEKRWLNYFTNMPNTFGKKENE